MLSYRTTRTRIHHLFEVGAGGQVGWWIDTGIMILILANVLSVILETVDPLFTTYRAAFYLFESISVAIFSVEYLGRVWGAPDHSQYNGAIQGRVKYMLSPYMIVDLLAILPFFVGAVIDLRFLRALRLVRFLRLFKLVRYSKSIRLFIRVIQRKIDDLVMTFSVTGILLVVASSIMYFLEHDAQPEVFSSIPATLWWGVVTLTTVGYGDVYPVTPLGKIFGAIIAIFGIGLFALPASILASGFIEEAMRQDPTKCPHCGEPLDHE